MVTASSGVPGRRPVEQASVAIVTDWPPRGCPRGPRSGGGSAWCRSTSSWTASGARGRRPHARPAVGGLTRGATVSSLAAVAAASRPRRRGAAASVPARSVHPPVRRPVRHGAGGPPGRGERPMPTHVVDSRVVTMCLGFAVLDAARSPSDHAVGGGEASLLRRRDRSRQPAPGGAGVRGRAPRLPTATEVAARSRPRGRDARCGSCRLARPPAPGRAARRPAAALGIVLGLRPILALQDGRIEVDEKVRARRAARDRLVALALRGLGPVRRPRSPSPPRGGPTSPRRWPRSGAGGAVQRLVESAVCESSAVLAAHAGPVLLAIGVADA